MKKTYLLATLLVMGCAVEPEQTPISDDATVPEENRITFITEWMVAGDTLVVVPIYRLMPAPVTADRIRIEVIAGGVPIYDAAFPFGAEQYNIPWQRSRIIQIVTAYTIHQ